MAAARPRDLNVRVARRATRSRAAARRGEDVATGREDGPGVSLALQTLQAAAEEGAGEGGGGIAAVVV